MTGNEDEEDEERKRSVREKKVDASWKGLRDPCTSVPCDMAERMRASDRSFGLPCADSTAGCEIRSNTDISAEKMIIEDLRQHAFP